MMRVYDRKSHLYGLFNLESIELNDMFGAFNLVVLWKNNPKRCKTWYKPCSCFLKWNPFCKFGWQKPLILKKEKTAA
jgi:hypothetical protein